MSSAHALVHIGEPHDLYYQDEKNAMKQAIPVSYNTRYTQEFSNKGSGTSVFVIPPNQGCKHALIVVGYNASSLSALTGSAALERGWGYSAIAQVSFRIGGSSQYFLTGAQLLARNLRLCRTKTQRNAILSLGGQECIFPGAASSDQYAYIPVSIWSAPGCDDLQVPLPTDLLSQQVQITCQLNPAASFWANSPNFATQSLPPAALDTAYFQVEQLEMLDRGQALSNRVDMSTHMYAMPLPTFDQFEVTQTLGPSAAVQQVVLTGFRAGEVKKVQIWCSPAPGSTPAGGSAGSPISGTANPQLWYSPKAVTLLYAGLPYAVYNNGSAAIWNLMDGTSPAAVDQSALTIATTSPYAFGDVGVLSSWVELPFAQPTGSDYEADVLVHGREITNGIVNLQVTLPDSTNAWVLHVVYVYNASIGFSKGSAELIF